MKSALLDHEKAENGAESGSYGQWITQEQVKHQREWSYLSESQDHEWRVSGWKIGLFGKTITANQVDQRIWVSLGGGHGGKSGVGEVYGSGVLIGGSI